MSRPADKVCDGRIPGSIESRFEPVAAYPNGMIFLADVHDSTLSDGSYPEGPLKGRR
jgi:hypothetical protein